MNCQRFGNRHAASWGTGVESRTYVGLIRRVGWEFELNIYNSVDRMSVTKLWKAIAT